MNERVYNSILIGILVISLGLLFFANTSAITGHATTAVTTSNVSIQKYLAIDPSAELEAGIYFGNVSSLPAIDLNGTNNYGGVSSSTLYYINVSQDSNTNVDFCILASANLTNPASATIPLINETYFVNNETNISIPDVDNQVSLTLSYVKPSTASNINEGGAAYWRFWLDVPVAQETGTYNNTISFKGVSVGVACS